MKYKIYKALVIILSFGIINFNTPHIMAGNGFSKLSDSKSNANEDLYAKTILSHPSHYPWCSADGGKAYYSAWHYINRDAFYLFLKIYSDIVDNKTSAKTLNDTVKDDTWDSAPNFGNAYEFLSFEQPDTIKSHKFLVRIDTKNKVIYTIRKNCNEYLCKFYIMVMNTNITTGKKYLASGLSYRWVLNNKSTTKNLLLPVDKALLD